MAQRDYYRIQIWYWLDGGVGPRFCQAGPARKSSRELIYKKESGPKAALEMISIREVSRSSSALDSELSPSIGWSCRLWLVDNARRPDTIFAEILVGDLEYCQSLTRGAVAGVIAIGAITAERTGQAAIVAGGINGIAKSLLVDAQAAVLVFDRHVGDGAQQDGGCIVGVCVEAGERVSVVLVLDARQEVVVGIARRNEGAGEIHAGSSIASGLDEFLREHSVGTHEGGVRQAFRVGGLGRDKTASRGEDRVVEHVGCIGLQCW